MRMKARWFNKRVLVCSGFMAMLILCLVTGSIGAGNPDRSQMDKGLNHSLIEKTFYKPAPNILKVQNKSQIGLGAIGGTGDTRALLIEDTAPWGVESDEQALIALGVPYDAITSDQLASTNLSEYNFIMYASDQSGSVTNFL